MVIVVFLIVAILFLLVAVYYGRKQNIEKEAIIKEQKEKIKRLEKSANAQKAKQEKPKQDDAKATISIREIDTEEAKVLYSKLNTELQELSEENSDKKNYKSKIDNLIQTLENKDKKELEKEDRRGEENKINAFIKKSETVFPQLTKTDLTLVAYLCEGKSTKEIATLTNKEIRSIESSRNRLRKKLELDSGEDLKEYFTLKLSEK